MRESQRPAAGQNDTAYVVRFESNVDDAAISIRTGSSAGVAGEYVVISYLHERLCLMPCNATVSAGGQHFMVTLADGTKVPSNAAVNINRNGALFANVIDRRPRRRRLLGVGSAVLAIGTGVLLASLATGPIGDRNLPMMIAGGAVALGGFWGGLFPGIFLAKYKLEITFG